MLSHFLWGPDKPTKQGENRALYWDACLDSLWIYGQQTVFITQPREAEQKGLRGWAAKEKREGTYPPFAFKTSEFEGNRFWKGSLIYYSVNILNSYSKTVGHTGK